MPDHVVPKKIYFAIFASLLALTGLTTGMAYVNLGPWNTIVALIIACCKATLVALFFMHLRWSPRVMRVVLLSALLWLAILISLTTTDFFSRDWIPIPEGWESSLLRRENFNRNPRGQPATWREPQSFARNAGRDASTNLEVLTPRAGTSGS
jgi:cytochrome c oxidase subunit 4